VSDSRRLRSVPFVPGNKIRMQDKAQTVIANAVTLNLGDSVPPNKQAVAPTPERQALASGVYEPYTVLREACSTPTRWSVGTRALCSSLARTWRGARGYV
jgi:hypothetical protein